MTDSKVIFEMIRDIAKTQLRIAETLDKISSRIELAEAVDLLIKRDVANPAYDISED